MGIIGYVLGWTFFIIGVELSLMGSWMLCRALWPRRVERAAERAAKRPVLSFLVGMPIVVVSVTVMLLLANKAGPPGSIAALFLLTGGFFYAATGVAGFATHIGSRLPSPIDDLRPWRATLRGGLVLGLSFLVPLIGLLMVLPATIMIGAGANTLSFFGRRKPLSPPPLDDAISARLSADAASYATRRPEEALR
jgi:hypothetical protein